MPPPPRSRAVRGHRLRAAALSALTVAAWCAVVLALLAVTGASAEAVRGTGPARPEDAVTLLAGAAGLLIAAWLALATVLTVLAAVLAASRPASTAGMVADRLAGRVAPATLRRAVFVAVGVGLLGATPAVAQPLPVTALPAVAVAAGPGGGGTGTAAAMGGSAGTPRAERPPVAAIDPAWAPRGQAAAATGPATAAGQPGLDPGWGGTAPTAPTAPTGRTGRTGRTGAAWPAAPVRPSPPVTGERASGAPGGRSGGGAGSAGRPGSAPVAVPGPAVRGGQDEGVVVRRGDCLWDVAARQLGPGATAAEIAAQWPRWYAANRSVIGADPDLLQPGQRLRPPRPDTSGDTGAMDDSGGRR